MPEAYPSTTQKRNDWILAHRGPRPVHDPTRPQSWVLESERAASSEVLPVATVFLTNRECPWRCLMCDLWQGTLTWPVPPGAIPAQIRFALDHLPSARQLKLYNSGSFFDAGAIPRADYRSIAELARPFERVIVESHPALVGEACLRFRDLLASSASEAHPLEPRLEVAMGLETAHPEVLARLNKRMTLGQFAAAAAFLRRHGIAVRVFVLVQPPFLSESEAVPSALRSVEFAFDCGASVVSLIPTRLGNGALDALAQRGEFVQPRLAALEHAAAAGVRMQRGRVFADLWDLERFSRCAACLPLRRAWLNELNLSQQVPPEVRCARCESGQVG